MRSMASALRSRAARDVSDSFIVSAAGARRGRRREVGGGGKAGALFGGEGRRVARLTVGAQDADVPRGDPRRLHVAPRQRRLADLPELDCGAGATRAGGSVRGALGQARARGVRRAPRVLLGRGFPGLADQSARYPPLGPRHRSFAAPRGVRRALEVRPSGLPPAPWAVRFCSCSRASMCSISASCSSSPAMTGAPLPTAPVRSPASCGGSLAAPAPFSRGLREMGRCCAGVATNRHLTEHSAELFRSDPVSSASTP